MRSISDNYNLPWLVAGDFNCIIDPCEKKRDSHHRMSKSLSFIQCIMDCELLDVGYSGSNFIWCNGRAPDRRVWQKLDRVLVNHQWADFFDSTSVNHLIRTGSDHTPLFISMKTKISEPIKYFKFLDFWTDEDDFMTIFQQAWNE